MTGNTASEGFNDSMMLQLLDHKMKNPRSSGSYRPEADDLTCPEDQSELAGFLQKHPTGTSAPWEPRGSDHPDRPDFGASSTA